MYGSSFQQVQQDKLRLGRTDQLINQESVGWIHFQKVYARGRMKRWTRRVRLLLDLNDILKQQSIINRHDAGLATIPLSKIRGSEGRITDFDAEFLPLTSHSAERWVSLYNAYDEGKTLPPIEVIQVEEIYYVRDGHHRVSVAKTIGQTYIEARIISISSS
ncbi:MAG: ParB N-terminal domain-containing protein [Anaerolineae bacterium]|nr:ParB N-terminal domain-containing protein [Anaerolineae bacterium]